MKPANPFRYLIHHGNLVVNKNETLDHKALASIGIHTLDDVHIMGKDFYQSSHSRGELISPIPGNMTAEPERDIANRCPDDEQLDFFHVSEHYSLCWEKGNLPDFDDLMRLDGLFLGYLPEFDGFKSPPVIPIARSPKQDSLPKSFCFDGQGNPVEHVEKKWQFLWEIGRAYYDSWIAENADDKLTLPQKIEMAMKVLAINYRIGKDEINAYFEHGRTVLNTTNIDRIMMNVIDVPNMAAKDLKKNSTEP